MSSSQEKVIDIRRVGGGMVDVWIRSDVEDNKTKQLVAYLDNLLFKEENLEWLMGIWDWHGLARSFSGIRAGSQTIIDQLTTKAKQLGFIVT